MTVYQSVHPSVNPCLPPLHPSQRQVSDWSGRGYFLRPHPSAGQEQGMMTDNTGSRRTHTHSPTHTYSAPTRLLVGFAVSCICILGSRRMHMQMPTMLIVIKGHLSLRFFFSLLFPRSLFCLSSPLYLSLSLLVCFSLSLSLSLSGPVSPSFTISSLSPTCLKQLIAVYSLPPLNVSVLISDISKQSLALSYQRRVYVSVAFSRYRSGSGSARALGSAGLMSG